MSKPFSYFFKSPLQKAIKQTQLYKKLSEKKYLNLDDFFQWNEVSLYLSFFTNFKLSELDHIAKAWLQTAQLILDNEDLNLYYLDYSKTSQKKYNDLSQHKFKEKECLFVYKNNQIFAPDSTCLLCSFARILEKNVQTKTKITGCNYEIISDTTRYKTLFIISCSQKGNIYTSTIFLHDIEKYQKTIHPFTADKLNNKEIFFNSSVVNIVLNTLINLSEEAETLQVTKSAISNNTYFLKLNNETN